MTRIFRHKAQKAGMAPGTLLYLGERKAERVRIHLIRYSPDSLEEREDADLAELLAERDVEGVNWINVVGLHEVPVVERLGRHFGLHHLVQEDILNVQQRPKLEDYEDYIFVVLRMLSWDEARGLIDEEQLGLVLGRGWVLSLQEREGDVLDPLRARIRAGKGRLRQWAADYLAYAIIDSVVDSYFVVLERLGERMDALEGELVTAPTQSTVRQIYRLKRELLYLRKAVWPLREVLHVLLRDDVKLVSAETEVYLRDVYDHTIHVIDTVETYRDIAGGMMDTYLTAVNNRMSEVMKVLTVIATIFIPLTFLAGVYGMNFEHMPELEWPWAYPAILAVMAGAALGMLYAFRRRGWF